MKGKLVVLFILFSSTDAFNSNYALRFSALSIVAPTQTRANPLTKLNLLDKIDTFYQTAPYAAAFITCGIKASAADFVAQKKFPVLSKKDKNKENENKDANEVSTTKTLNRNPFNFQRNSAFIVYGAMYQGCAQEYIFNHIFPVLFGTGTSLLTVLSKVVFDMMVLTPFLCLPLAYLVKAVIFKYSLKEGLQRYKYDIFSHGLLKKYWSLWFPVQCLTFSVVPEHWRITWIACVSFFWLIILSSISTRAKATTESAVAVTPGNQKIGILSEPDNINMSSDIDDQECSLVDGMTCEIDG